ncbi:hypothetical protein R3Q06_33400 [Rhodococcus erythropolis]|uniref:LGFP repeat-containing protein n=1 Tax=Rhodococcus erythropolis TaxID=1833 RepID=UPI0029498AC9|nr:hypothetical protein [Rhodococcus erythropolis]MDV6278337.1 hypothetical protein [Rhodococcus erythropolis]
MRTTLRRTLTAAPLLAAAAISVAGLAGGIASAAPAATPTDPQPTLTLEDSQPCQNHWIFGEIEKKYYAAGARTTFGCPETDEMTTSDKVGKFNNFQHGAIYWSPKTGAHPVTGAILSKWRAAGAEASKAYGYPLEDPQVNGHDPSDQYQRFEHGTLTSK